MWIIGVWITCLFCLQESKHSSDGMGYTVDEYDESPGVYYEHLGQVTFFTPSGKR
jgi:hypothetical protein